jgi:uncharacterized membrane protein YsdA (DUF1294 family)
MLTTEKMKRTHGGQKIFAHPTSPRDWPPNHTDCRTSKMCALGITEPSLNATTHLGGLLGVLLTQTIYAHKERLDIRVGLKRKQMTLHLLILIKAKRER